MKRKPGKTTEAERERARTELSIQIGKAAREARLKLKLTQADVAERVNLSGEVYGKLERGAMLPSAPTLIKLRTALGVSADYLMGLAADAHPEGLRVAPATDEEMSPEVRRLLRLMRTMDDEQLDILKGTAAGFVRLKKRREQPPTA
ncbi:helix-turn-helix domain-containing protein [Melittangium boletus]|uniref:helix-turn-helix domain-containing protein n=1 Tax=Melittangium boletus TaxID=83453 RepID=UPI000BB2E007|nr:helix-turn-helix transcriptional regulator [Melittangium boletus]